MFYSRKLFYVTKHRENKIIAEALLLCDINLNFTNYLDTQHHVRFDVLTGVRIMMSFLWVVT
jgi:hypothetical protein